MKEPNDWTRAKTIWQKVGIIVRGICILAILVVIPLQILSDIIWISGEIWNLTGLGVSILVIAAFIIGTLYSSR